MSLLLSGFAALPAHGDNELVVISHKDIKTDVLKKRMLRNIFTLNMPRWPDGTVTKVVSLGHTTPFHQQFTRTYLSVLSYQLQRHWERVIFSGRASPPVVVKSFPEMAAYVAKTPGAIGYLQASLVVDSVKTISIKD